MAHNLYLSLGSNLGDRRATIQQALALIDQRVGSVYKVSSFLETEPVGFSSPHRFLNIACLVHTMMSPLACLRETRLIEQQLGRTDKSLLPDGTVRYQDRTIDIDILLYDDLSMSTPELTLPHPHMRERDFVMTPLREIMEAADL